MRRLFFILALAIADAASALTFTTHLIVRPAPEALLVSATNDSILYETYHRTLYRSVDGGATFTVRSAVNDYVAIDPVNPDLLYDTAQGIVRRSSDGGATWTSIRNNLPSFTPTPRALLVTPRRTLFLASTCVRDHMGGGVFSSANFGDTWSGDPNSGDCISNISVDPISESVWSTLENALINIPYTYLAPIVASERAPDIRFGIVSYINSNPPKTAQVVRTTDGWKSSQTLTVDGTPYALELDSDSGRLFLSTSSGLYWSDDRGTSWTRVTGAPAGAIAFMRIAGATLFIRTAEGSYRAPLATPGPFTPLGPLPLEVPATVNALAIDPNSGALYASGFGVWRSSDAGQHWETISPTAERRGAITVDGIGDVYAFGYLSSDATLLWHYTTASRTWEKLTVPLAYQSSQLLVANPAQRGVLYAIALGGLFISQDGGHSWRKVPETGYSVTGLAVDPNRPDVVYAASLNGLFISVDGGGMWRLLDAAVTNSIVVAPSRSATLHRIRYDPSNSIGRGMLERSDDSGATWQPRLATYLGSLLLVDPRSEDSVWLSGIHSIDGGKTWTPISSDAPGYGPAQIYDWVIDRDGTHMHAILYTTRDNFFGEWDAVLRAERRRAARP